MSHQQLMNTSLSRPTGASKMGIDVSRTSIQFGQQVDKAISTMGRHQDMLITTLPGAFSEWSLGSGLHSLEIGQTPCMICMGQVTIPGAKKPVILGERLAGRQGISMRFAILNEELVF